MISNTLVSLTSVFLLLQSLFLTVYIFKIIKVKKHTPIQLNWLAEANFLMGILQIFLLFHTRVFGLSHFLNFAIMLYYSLYMTKFNRTKNSVLQRAFVMLAHICFNFITIFFVVSVYLDKYQMRAEDLNLYLAIYNGRYLFLGLITILLVSYSLLSLKDEKLKPSVKSIQYFLILGNILILLSYVLKQYYPIIYVFYSVSMIITNVLIWYHICIEKGRFIDD